MPPYDTPAGQAQARTGPHRSGSGLAGEALRWAIAKPGAAARLLAPLADAALGFDAVVVGEPQRAFYGNQFGNTFRLFARYKVPL